LVAVCCDSLYCGKMWSQLRLRVKTLYFVRNCQGRIQRKAARGSKFNPSSPPTPFLLISLAIIFNLIGIVGCLIGDWKLEVLPLANQLNGQIGFIGLSTVITYKTTYHGAATKSPIEIVYGQKPQKISVIKKWKF